MKKILFVLLFFVGAAQAAVYEYDLSDEGGFLNDCNNATQVSPAPACNPDDKWYPVDTADGTMEYNWVVNGEVYINATLCAEDNKACKYINERFTVVKSFPDKISYVINQQGELLETLMIFNPYSNKFIFGSREVGYIVKGSGDAPDWVYQQ